MGKKYTIEEVREFFTLRGYTLLSLEYENNSAPLNVLCPRGHLIHPNVKNFHNKKRGCLTCSGSEKWDIEEIRIILKNDSYTLLSTEYKNSGSKISIRCERGHNWDVSWENYYLNKARCPDCQGLKRRSTEEVSEIFIKQGYTLITDNFINAHQTLHTVCPNGHNFHTTLNRFTCPSKSRCGECFPLFNEVKCRKVFESLFGKFFIKSRPSFLLPDGFTRGLELDGFNIELKLAFEYDGQQHFKPVYGTEQFNKQKLRDVLKNELCKKEGVTLIRIPYFVKNKEEYIKEELTKRGIQWQSQ